MSILHKAGFAVMTLSGMSLAASAQAQTLTVTAPSSPSFANGAYNYVYNLTSTANTTQMTFSFTDPNVFFVSTTGSLTTVFQPAPGNFFFYGTPGTVQAGGTTETVTFTSPDPPKSSVSMTSSGAGLSASVNGVIPAPGAVPAAVPEASTTVSFGLLLALGLGGVVIAAKKKNAASA